MTLSKKAINAGLILLMGALIFALIRGCQNNKIQLGQVNQLIEKHNADSIKMFNDSVDFANRMQYAEGKLELNYNQYISSQDSIGILNDKLAKSKAKRIIIEPKLDTSIMEVPTEFVSQCNDCWGQLDHYKSVVDTYTAHSDSLRASYVVKNKIQEKRIKQLDTEKAELRSLFNYCMDVANNNKKRYEPRRKVFLTFTGLTQFHVYTIGAGAGLLYMDKRERIFGGNAYATNNGGLYTASISFPLSFKRIK